jgi:4-hydroxybenzoate polyprenyltransferase
MRKGIPEMTAILGKIKLYADLVKFEHTIFALPFALSALLLASGNQWPSFQTVCWVILAMVGGRTYAMGLNRIIDERIDGENPRTKNRPIPAGRVNRFEAMGLTLLSLGLLTVATRQLPPLCFQLLPLAIVFLTAYSYIKRFSNMAHLVLGLCLGSSAIGGWIAVTGTLDLPALLFGLAVMFWVAGFDIIYACQDVTFDREYGLFSIPASWGIRQGLIVSRMLHVLTVLMLVGVGLLTPFIGVMYWAAVALVTMMLLYEHSLVNDQDLSRVNDAFFMVNGFISVGVFLLVLINKALMSGLLLQ